MRFARQELERFGAELLTTVGCDGTCSDLVARTLVRSDARGVPSHGIVRLADYLVRLDAGGNDPAGRPRIVHQRGGIAIVDGELALGQLVATFAMGHAIQLAQANGIGAVACRRSSHFGAAAEYAEMAASESCIGIAMTNASPSMAPWGGISPLMGNNPIAIAAPTSRPDVFVLDMALSVVARGRVRMMAARGEPIPSGWAYNKLGEPTTDSAEAVAGLAAWAGDHKGFGLALAVDTLSGILSGAGFATEVRSQQDVSLPQEIGHFFIAIHVPDFIALTEFRQRMGEMLASVRSSRPAKGSQGVQIPGEPELESERASEGLGIRVEKSVWARLMPHAERLKVALPSPLSGAL